MPVLQENTIDKTWVHNWDVETSNASSFVRYRKVFIYLRQRSMVLICSCGADHFLLYYFVLTLRSLAFVPWYSPTLSRWNVSKPDVWFLFCSVLFCFVLSRRFFSVWFGFVCSGFLLIKSNCSYWQHKFIQIWMGFFRWPLSQKMTKIKSIVPILYMWDV